MALNFPNNPTSGQTHTGVNNIEYRYDGEKWITLGSTNVIGTDPTFNSLEVNGAGTFAGDVNGKAITSTYGLYNRRVSGVLTNHIECTTDGFNNFKVDPSGNVEIGSSSQITLLSDGSASFAGGTSNNPTVTAQKNNSNGAFPCFYALQDSNSGSLFLGRNGFTGKDTVNISADGSASFAKTIQCGSTNANQGTGTWIQEVGGVYTTRPAGSTAAVFTAYQQGAVLSPTVEINADGSATFAAGDIEFFSSGASIHRGAINVYRTVGANSGLIVGLTTGGVDSNKTVLSADGSATFAGTIVNGSPNSSSTTSGGNLFSSSGLVRVQRPVGTDPSNQVFESYLGTNSVFQITCDGSATFAGNITAGNVSDIKFKENITDANPQLSDVVALGSNLKNWDWKEEAPLNDELKSKRFLGLIAQEAEQICPGVTYEVGEGEDSYKAINHDILVMKLLGAVTELKAEINELKANQP